MLGVKERVISSPEYGMMKSAESVDNNLNRSSSTEILSFVEITEKGTDCSSELSVNQYLKLKTYISANRDKRIRKTIFFMFTGSFFNM